MTDQITQEEADQLRRDELNDVCAVMATGEGRRFIWRLLEKGHIFATPYAGATNDTMFNLGNHNLALWVFSEVTEANIDLYLMMQREQHKDKDDA